MDKLDYFFQKYGGLTIVITRFMPFFRTFAPFIAGMGHMNFSKFTLFNTIGGVAWVSLFVLVGYFFGGVPFVQEHFEVIVLGIVARFGGSRFHRRDQDRAVFAQSQERESLGGFMAEALYRKYRPSTFEDVVGPGAYRTNAQKRARAGKGIARLSLLRTTRYGQDTMARILAKALLCEKAPTIDPDGTCEECLAIAAGTHPDVYELDAASRTGRGECARRDHQSRALCAYAWLL